MDVLVFLIVVALIWLLVWLIYRIILTKSENSKFQWVRLCIWLPLHEWNMLWRYLLANESIDPYGLSVMTFSWIEKRMFMAGWFDYIAKKQNPILNSFLSLSYESELLVDNIKVLGLANCSCDVIYNNESITLEEYEDYFVVKSYVTSSLPIIVPNFLKLMQSILANKYHDFQFQTIESDSSRKQTILFNKRIAKEDSYKLSHWQTRYNLLDVLSSFAPVREDCVRIFNMRAAALNGSSNKSSNSKNLLECMHRIVEDDVDI